MKYTAHQAKTTLSRLLEEACEGKEAIIAPDKQPVAKLVVIGRARKQGCQAVSPEKFPGLRTPSILITAHGAMQSGI